jgi:hypothetical protein
MADTSTTAFPASDQLIASAARFLIEGGEEEAANVILACRLESIETTNSTYSGNTTVYSVIVRLRGPRLAHDVMKDSRHRLYASIHEAIGAALPHDAWIETVSVRTDQIDLGPEWRAELLELASGKSVKNQGVGAPNTFTWQGFKFRSPAEISVAEALDRAGVMFFPLAYGRLNLGTHRVNREPDFLVCHNGKWGVLEVDGMAFHKGRAAEDHERDRLFKAHGVKVVERYTGKYCIDVPDAVVKQFLEILEKNG